MVATSFSAFNSVFNLVNEVFKGGIGVPWLLHHLLIGIEVEWCNCAARGDEMVEHVSCSELSESHMAIADCSQAHRLNSTEELFFF